VSKPDNVPNGVRSRFLAKKVLVYGTGMMSEVVVSLIRQHFPDTQILGLIDKAEFVATSRALSYSVFDRREIGDRFDISEIPVVLGVGFGTMNRERKDAFEFLELNGHKIQTLIHPSASISDDAVVNDGAVIFDGVSIGPFAEVGAASIVWSNCVIGHHSRVGAFSFLAGPSALGGRVTLGECSYVGLNVTIKDGVSIGAESFIGATVYVNNDLPDYSVCYGQRSKLNKLSSRQLFS